MADEDLDPIDPDLYDDTAATATGVLGSAVIEWDPVLAGEAEADDYVDDGPSDPQTPDLDDGYAGEPDPIDGTLDAEAATYDVYLRAEDQPTEQYVGSTPDTTWTFSGLTPGNYAVSIMVRFGDQASELAAQYELTMGGETFADVPIQGDPAVAPGQPSAPVLTSSLGILTATWDGLLDGDTPTVDFSHVRAEVSIDGTWTALGATRRTAGDIDLTGLTVGTSYDVRLVAVGVADLESDPSDSATATVIAIQSTELADEITADIAEALANSTAGLASLPIFSDTTPTVDPDRAVNTVWYQTSGGDIVAVYQWDGTDWQPRAMTDAVLTSVSAAKIATGTLSAAVTLSGVIQTDEDADRGVKITSDGIVAYDASGDVTFQLNASTGEVDSITVTAGDISGVTITGSTVRTAASGQRLELNTTGLISYDPSNAVTASLKAASGGMNLAGALNIVDTVTGFAITTLNQFGLFIGYQGVVAGQLRPDGHVSGGVPVVDDFYIQGPGSARLTLFPNGMQLYAPGGVEATGPFTAPSFITNGSTPLGTQIVATASSTSVPTGTSAFTQIPLTTVGTGGSLSGGQFVFPATGTWIIFAFFSFGVDSTGIRRVRIGTSLAGIANTEMTSPPATSAVVVSTQWQVDGTANLYLLAEHTASGALNVTARMLAIKVG